MKAIILIAAAISLYFSSVSCVSTKKTMNSWVGHTESEVIIAWGPPNQVTNDGNGGKILIYSSQVTTYTAPGTVYNNGYGGVNYTNPQTYGYSRVRMFYINAEGKVYYWKAQGL